MAWNVLTRNGVLQLQDPGPAAPFLRSHPSGAYTTTRSTNNASQLLLWERHLERLSQSVKLLSEQTPSLFPNDPAKFPYFDDYLKSMVQPSLCIGLQKALEVRNDDEELMVMAFITGATHNVEENTHSNEYNGFEVYVHISRCLPMHPESLAKSAAQVAIMGLGRSLPNAKHSDWVRARQALEKTRPEDVTEIILSNDGDLLLEGMVSNFFVVRMDMLMEANTCIDGNKKWENVVLQTAPLKGVLPGVVRKLILEICGEQGIPFEESPPSWRGRHLWVEAFTTNSVRLIQPVRAIQCPVHWNGTNEPRKWQENSWEHLTLQATGSLTQFIQVWLCLDFLPI
eukprot:c24718_g1_i1 orf=714-1736(-)